MICMRTVLESTSRDRAHRLKAAGRMAKLEERNAGPHRWLEAAGWGRLAPFNQALGEFCHTQVRSRRHRARDLLTVMQRDTPEVGAEHDRHAAAAKTFCRLTLGTDDAGTIERVAEDWLSHGFSFKGFDLDGRGRQGSADIQE